MSMHLSFWSLQLEGSLPTKVSATLQQAQLSLTRGRTLTGALTLSYRSNRHACQPRPEYVDNQVATALRALSGVLSWLPIPLRHYRPRQAIRRWPAAACPRPVPPAAAHLAADPADCCTRRQSNTSMARCHDGTSQGPAVCCQSPLTLSADPTASLRRHRRYTNLRVSRWDTPHPDHLFSLAIQPCPMQAGLPSTMLPMSS